MHYVSTRGKAQPASSAQAILQGLAPDGGLFMSAQPLAALHAQGDYAAVAASVLQAAFSDSFSSEQLSHLAKTAYSTARFDAPEIAPLTAVGRHHVLELFHGPTASFKDMALSVLPGLMSLAKEQLAPGQDIVVLTATSGDTGSATMAGFRGMPGFKVIVFYPEHGVSPVQQAQMQRMAGDNLCAVAIRGDFDQAQHGVKGIFARRQELAPNTLLSSANSINIGRLIPQMAYYLKASQQLDRRGIPFSVPTGNFGDIFAGALALGESPLICATNDNDVLKDCLQQGIYDRRRQLKKTLSPSMDILVSSNFERALYLAGGADAARTAQVMHKLEQEGAARIPETMHHALQARYLAASCSDAQALASIRSCWQQHGYLMDPHSVAGWHALQQFGMAEGVVVSTASPYKFPAAVLTALELDVPEDPLAQIRTLEQATGVSVPASLDGLFEQPVLHDTCIDADQMAAFVQQKVAVW